MLDTIRLWLNGKRDYNTGVVLFSQISKNQALISLLLKEKTPYTVKRLSDEMLAICNSLKESYVFTKGSNNPDPGDIEKKIAYRYRSVDATNTTRQPKEPINQDLYNICKKEADLAYKEAMNMRAVLFSHANVEDWQDPNQPDLIEKRSKLSVQTVNAYNNASRLYDKADFVKQHGRLPGESNEDNDNDNYEHLPDVMVKQTLDNLRKNLNKIRKKEETPERLVSIEKHQYGIKILEERWLLLKPVNL